MRAPFPNSMESPVFAIERTSLTHDLLVLTVAGIIVNSISVTLSALTSLDWTTASTKEKKFLQQLENVTHIHHEGSRLVLVVKKEEEEED